MRRHPRLPQKAPSWIIQYDIPGCTCNGHSPYIAGFLGMITEEHGRLYTRCRKSIVLSSESSISTGVIKPLDGGEICGVEIEYILMLCKEVYEHDFALRIIIIAYIAVDGHYSCRLEVSIVFGFSTCTG